MKPSICLAAVLIAAFVVVACASSGTPPGPVVAIATAGNSVQYPVRKHRRHGRNAGSIDMVFVIVQENRTVDNLFNGFPNADTQSYGYFGTTKINLQPDPIATAPDLNHSLAAFNQDTGCPPVPSVVPWSCPMNGFTTPPPSGSEVPDAYAYVKKDYTKPYWAMGEQYVFGDEMFQSQLDGSYTAHQYLVAGQANSTTDFPVPAPCNGYPTPKARWVTQLRAYGKDPEWVTACQTYPTTIAKELDHKYLPWRYYTANPGAGYQAYWDPFYWIIGGGGGGTGSGSYGYQNGKIVKNPCTFLKDIKSSSGYSADVTWITPSAADSDHASATMNEFGPDWVTAVVNAIGKSKYWDESVIFITWDDWGGWYDHVFPPYKDYDGLGNRVPFIIISPYSKTGVVTHQQYEQASILRYIEDLYSLDQMAASDTRAYDPANDPNIWISGTPRPFATFSPYPAGYECNDPGPPDTD